MADTHRVMIRLSPEIYAQLAAHGCSGQPLAAIVRHALVQYLNRQPEQPEQPVDIRAMVTTLNAHIHALQSQVRALTARVDALAAPQQPQAAPEQPRAAHKQLRSSSPPLPRPSPDVDAAYGRMQALQAQGVTLSQIAAQLTAEGFRTKQSRPWHKSTVSYVLRTHGR